MLNFQIKEEFGEFWYFIEKVSKSKQNIVIGLTKVLIYFSKTYRNHFNNHTKNPQ